MPKHIDRFATIAWEEGDTPVATLFDDPYFAREDGRAETGHVFLSANGLPERWQSAKTFSIAELGFGTGLNFLETLRQWQAAPGTCTRLHFVSFERYPLQAVDMARAMRRWPDLGSNLDKLLAAWPPPAGVVQHRIPFGDATLDVMLGNANTTVPAWPGFADAWYLDGFSPARNADLWGEALMAAVYAHTRPGGTFATYTAAGWVRRNLAAAGFEVRKVPGYGRKRESLAGVRAGSNAPA